MWDWQSRIGRWQVILLAMMAGIVTPSAQAYPQSHGEVRAWIASNAICESTFEAVVSEPAFLQALKQMGFMLPDLIPAGPPEGVWFVPKGISVLGYRVKAIHYWSDRGSEFYVEVPTTLAALQQRFDLKPASTAFRQSDGYLAIKWVGKRTQPNSALLFVRQGRHQQLVEMGCRRYSPS